ncbi:MAG: hypothetical protein NT007_14310 [Candidatus Kapabacteria bacterium]|nr:hypothetical protein [Candidatus Kapabacteria bacterium]
MFKSILLVLVIGFFLACGGPKTEKERIVSLMTKATEWISSEGFVDEVLTTAKTPMEVSEVINAKLTTFRKDFGFNNDAELDSLLVKYEKEQDKDFMKVVHNLDNAYSLKMEQIIGKMTKDHGGMGMPPGSSTIEGANPHGGATGANPHGGATGTNPHAAPPDGMPNDDVHSKVKKNKD